MVSIAPGVTVQVTPPSRPAVVVAPPAASVVQVAPIVGPRGPVGPPGGSGFSYVQTTPAASWPVIHNLGRYPYAVTIKVGGSLQFTDVDFPDLNTVVLTFATPTAGRVDII